MISSTSMFSASLARKTQTYAFTPNFFFWKSNMGLHFVVFQKFILFWTSLLQILDHILSDLSTMTHPSWVAPRAWLSFIELDKAVVHVIRLASFLWLWFQCVCHLMPSCNTYHLTWVFLTLDVGYLFTAAPAKCSHCSLPWTRSISSRLPLLTLNME